MASVLLPTTIGNGHGYRAAQVVLAIDKFAAGKQCRIAEHGTRDPWIVFDVMNGQHVTA
jgi:hypothetical protein